ncbi:MAG: hypothetical protein H6826_13730 [Planctomycetes bacterium]|nr:hypothetical protein [Planctomycetota bacterium]
MPAREVIRVDADGVMYFEHPRGALLDYSVDLVNDPSGPAVGSAVVVAQGVNISPATGLKVGNGADAYTPPSPPAGGSVTPAAPTHADGILTFWLWTDAGAQVGDQFDVEAWYRTTGPIRVSRAKLRLRIT